MSVPAFCSTTLHEFSAKYFTNKNSTLPFPRLTKPLFYFSHGATADFLGKNSISGQITRCLKFLAGCSHIGKDLTFNVVVCLF